MLGAVVAGYFIGGSPPYIQGVKADSIKVNNIQDLKYFIETYVEFEAKLPDSLEELQSNENLKLSFKNISTKQKDIEYKKISDSTYSLCATFTADSNPSNSYYTSEELKHPAGYYCYEFKSRNKIKAELSPTPIPLKNSSMNLSTPLTSCKTLDTKMIIEKDGTGTIGCDIEVNGSIDIQKSFCQGMKSKKYAYLKPDTFDRPNRYYATLTGLDPKESVEVVAINQSGNFSINCKPNLN